MGAGRREAVGACAEATKWGCDDKKLVARSGRRNLRRCGDPQRRAGECRDGLAKGSARACARKRGFGAGAARSAPCSDPHRGASTASCARASVSRLLSRMRARDGRALDSAMGRPRDPRQPKLLVDAVGRKMNSLRSARPRESGDPALESGFPLLCGNERSWLQHLRVNLQRLLMPAPIPASPRPTPTGCAPPRPAALPEKVAPARRAYAAPARSRRTRRSAGDRRSD